METSRVVIDTDILIDVLRNVTDAVSAIREMEKKQYLLSTTTINAFELYHGAYRSKQREKNIASAKILLKRLIVLRMGLKSAQNAGRIHAELEMAGRPIGLRDAMVGAIALTQGYSLATRNVKHYRRIDGLDVISIP